ncbi:uncharacterized protein BJ171DRAFT_294928 [Polychytrium aggregatum]|uniref:uncharacterized protein n=1 Tax=Polychytrium aggregatum TaxID=110093 RepID=UPI0022FDC4E7|nr:uncharacterized protein BJ171DRAFT_294928 [Polychytrium aggregatum]KAI9207304.1 hypothetical protein BJ171DRAFT_294928 [Polychytrium aggregatum]
MVYVSSGHRPHQRPQDAVEPLGYSRQRFLYRSSQGCGLNPGSESEAAQASLPAMHVPGPVVDWQSRSDQAAYVLHRLVYGPAETWVAHTGNFRRVSSNIARLLSRYHKIQPLLKPAFYYVDKFCAMVGSFRQKRQQAPMASAEPASEPPISISQMFSIFRVALVLAQKFHHDQRYSNSSWATIFGISMQSLNQLEWEFLEVIGYELFIPDDHWQAFATRIGILEAEFYFRTSRDQPRPTALPIPSHRSSSLGLRMRSPPVHGRPSSFSYPYPSPRASPKTPPHRSSSNPWHDGRPSVPCGVRCREPHAGIPIPVGLTL